MQTEQLKQNMTMSYFKQKGSVTSRSKKQPKMEGTFYAASWRYRRMLFVFLEGVGMMCFLENFKNMEPAR